MRSCAATALVHGMTLVTRNIADFEGTERPFSIRGSSETPAGVHGAADGNRLLSQNR